MGRDEWRFNYLGMFLSISGIVLVITCALIAYRAVDFTEAKLEGPPAATSTLTPPTVTIGSSTTTSTPTTTSTTLAHDFEDRNRQDFLAVLATLMAATKIKLTVFNNALEAGDDETTQRLAGEMALLWNSAPPRAPTSTPFAAEYLEARQNVGNDFLALYDALSRHSRPDTASAKSRITIEAIPLIDALEQAIGP